MLEIDRILFFMRILHLQIAPQKSLNAVRSHCCNNYAICKIAIHTCLCKVQILQWKQKHMLNYSPTYLNNCVPLNNVERAGCEKVHKKASSTWFYHHYHFYPIFSSTRADPLLYTFHSRACSSYRWPNIFRTASVYLHRIFVGRAELSGQEVPSGETYGPLIISNVCPAYPPLRLYSFWNTSANFARDWHLWKWYDSGGIPSTLCTPLQFSSKPFFHCLLLLLISPVI